MKKLVLLLLLAGSMLLSMMGCQPEIPSKTVLRVEYTTALTLSEQDPVLLWLQQCSERWEDPNYQVEVTALYDNSSTFYAFYSQLFGSPTASPDALICSSSQLAMERFSKGGYLHDLTELLSENPNWKEGYFESVADSAAQHGGIYGIPCLVSVNGLWYHRSLLQEAGVSLPLAPKNWKEVLAALQAVSTTFPDTVPFASTINDPAIFKEEKEFLRYLETEEMNKAEDFGVREVDLTRHLELFRNQEIAVLMASHFTPRYFDAESQAPWNDFAEQIGFAPFPAEDGNGFILHGNIQYLSIMETSAHKEAMFSFWQYCMEDENYLPMIVQTPYLPSRKSAAKEMVYQNDPYAMAQLDCLDAIGVVEDNRFQS